MPCQQQNILSPFPQRRDCDRDDTDPVKEVFTKRTLLYHFTQILVRGKHKTDIDRNIFRSAETADISFFQDSQKFGLQRETHVADFIEQHRPPVGVIQ
ncbi:MAG: hypothetical protein A4E74_02203 [Syntrophus sp. PtaB.Bin075]|nr:MAG: hypothetical protein A4E74_02203 [Syntrophus sp. PtaB.Bin075]